MKETPKIWIFATGNANKVAEVQQIAGEKLEFRSLTDMGYYEDIPEDYDTLERNAVQKAQFAYSKFGLPCFSEDSGLEVEALQGAPGVYSARYAGVHGDHRANIEKLLKELSGIEIRNAQFRTVFALVDVAGDVQTFEGVCRGQIAHQMKGSGGFGYDPVFVPDGYRETFAEIESALKNKLSHRGKALAKLLEYLGIKE